MSVVILKNVTRCALAEGMEESIMSVSATSEKLTQVLLSSNQDSSQANSQVGQSRQRAVTADEIDLLIQQLDGIGQNLKALVSTQESNNSNNAS